MTSIMTSPTIRKRSASAAIFFALLATATYSAVSASVENPESGDQAGDWPAFNRTMSSQRYSPLSEINRQNVRGLKVKCTFALNEKLNFQNGPIVIGGVMYVTSETDTYAIDAATCEQRWRHHRTFKSPEGSLRVNRGAVYSNGKIFRGSNDGYLLALNAETGDLVWAARMANPGVGESLPAVPVVWNGMVFMGQAGGDNVGVRGRMMAFDANDGRQLWTFDLAPLTGPGSETWPPPTPQVPRTGAATWTSYSIDETNGTLLVPTGNAAPDFIKSVRPGLNLYSNSVVILDATTGQLRSYYQVTQQDFHGWDVASSPVVYRGSNGHKMAAEAGKDGFLHLIDLDLQKVIARTVTTSRINTTVPITTRGTRFCPGTQGGSEWNGAAYEPNLSMLYVPAVDWCTTVKLDPEGLPPIEAMDPKTKWSGWLTAVNADNGKVRWRYHAPSPVLAAATPTAGGLVFTSDVNGNFMAFNSVNGRILFRTQIGEPTAGGIITYTAGGKQLIAVATGMQSPLWQTETSGSKILVYGL